MKFLSTLSLAAAFLAAGLAHAEMKPHGTYVPYLCSKTANARGGVAVEIVAARQVCFGRIVGFNGRDDQYVSVALNDGETRVYQISERVQIPTTFDRQTRAELLTLNYVGTLGRGSFVVRNRMHEVWTARAEYSLNGAVLKLEGKTAGNVKVKASEFEYVLTTMGGGL